MHEQPWVSTDTGRGVLPRICAHCGQSQPLTSADIYIDTVWFCCTGCATVYQLLNSTGLGEFYKLREQGYCSRPAKPATQITEHYNSWNSKERNYKLYVENVHCTACLWLIEKLSEIDSKNVKQAHLDFAHSLLQIELTDIGEISRVADQLASWGYVPHLIQSQDQAFALEKKENRARLIDLGVAGALAGNIMLMSIPIYAGAELRWMKLFAIIAAALATVSVVYSARSFFSSVYTAIKQRRFSIDAPILLAIVVAFFYSVGQMLAANYAEVYFDSLSSLIFLLLASRYVLTRLRQYGLGEARAFRFVQPDVEHKIGDRVTLETRKKLNFDAIIRSGRGFFNNSVLTGESLPKECRSGDMVYAGAVYEGPSDSSLAVQVEVHAVGENTRLEKIMSEVRKQTSKRSAREHLFDRYAQGLLIVVTITAFSILAYFGYRSEWIIGFHRMLALLIVTCPCALALATPLAQALFLKSALAQGVLIRDVEALETANDVDVLAFDKTGTLTHGQLNVETVELRHGTTTEDMCVLRSLAHHSRHPVARAIASHLGLGKMADLNNFNDVAGDGVTAEYKQSQWRLGRPQEKTIEGQNHSLLCSEFSRDRQLLARYHLSDRERSEALQIAKYFKSKNTQVKMLTGDRNSAAIHVANQIGIEPTDVMSDCSPEQKAQIIKDFKVKNNVVAIVGDGVNDALAMSHADLSIVVHGGVEAVQSTATVAILKEGLWPVIDFFKLSRRLMRLHRINFIYSTAYNAVSGILAVTGFMNPLIAAIVMPTSALTVFAATFFYVKSLKSESEGKPA